MGAHAVSYYTPQFKKLLATLNAQLFICNTKRL